MANTILDLMNLVKNLSLEEKRSLNNILVQDLRHAHKVKNVVAAAAFHEGDFVEFDAKTRGFITIQITDFSRDGSKVKGVQINKGRFGSAQRGMKWTATAAVCKAVSAEVAARRQAMD